MGNNYKEDTSDDLVILTVDGDEKVECAVVGIFEASNGLEYIALLPNDGADAEAGLVYLYRYSENEEEEPVLENILDDDEFEIASDAFDEFLDVMEFNDMLKEEE